MYLSLPLSLLSENIFMNLMAGLRLQYTFSFPLAVTRSLRLFRVDNICPGERTCAPTVPSLSKFTVCMGHSSPPSCVLTAIKY